MTGHFATHRMDRDKSNAARVDARRDPLTGARTGCFERLGERVPFHYDSGDQSRAEAAASPFRE